MSPLSAEANASMRDTGSTAASAQSAGKRKFTQSDGAMSAMAATTVDDAGCGERPSRALNPATRPPTAAPPRTAMHASTLLLMPLERPRMSPRTADLPQTWLHLLCKPSVIMAAPGHFFGDFLLVREGVSPVRPWPAPGITKARRRRRASLSFKGGEALMPPLPPPPRPHPRPPPRRAWDRAAAPWQARLRSP